MGLTDDSRSLRINLRSCCAILGGSIMLVAASQATAVDTNPAHRAQPTKATLPGPGLVYRGESGAILYVESDRRHLAAISSSGRLLWMRDPFKDAKVEPYRFKRPLIIYLGHAGDACGKWKRACVAIAYDSSQFGVISLATGELNYMGHD